MSICHIIYINTTGVTPYQLVILVELFARWMLALEPCSKVLKRYMFSDSPPPPSFPFSSLNLGLSNGTQNCRHIDRHLIKYQVILVNYSDILRMALASGVCRQATVLELYMSGQGKMVSIEQLELQAAKACNVPHCAGSRGVSKKAFQ